jgi:Ni,Fe-hydrogenase III small subunit
MNLTGTGQVMGTPTTMAPEQFDDPEGVDFRADIYGLGCVAYHALIGRPAFDGKTLAQIVTAKVSGVAPNPTAVITGLSPAIGQLVADMLAKNKDARPQSYEALIARCAALIDGKAPTPGGTLPWLVIGGVGVAAAVILAVLMMPKETRTGAAANATPPVAPITPASVTVPVAPPMPATATLGAPQLLWRQDVSTRLKDWVKAEGAQWSSPEEADHGIVGAAGRISRTLEPGPWVIDAILQLGENPDGRTDEAHLGFQLANGQGVYVQITNNGPTLPFQVWQTYPDPQAAPQFVMNGSLPPGKVNLTFTFAEHFLRLTANGAPLEKGISLPGDPTGLYLSTTGTAPLFVHDLSIRRPAAPGK